MSRKAKLTFSKPYVRLIERVRVIDPKAAEYMEKDAPKLNFFQECDHLINVFIWGDTPQGGEYWAKISDQLG